MSGKVSKSKSRWENKLHSFKFSQQAKYKNQKTKAEQFVSALICIIVAVSTKLFQKKSEDQNEWKQEKQDKTNRVSEQGKRLDLGCLK